MKSLFDDISSECSELTTKRYSTSFSLGIRFLDKKFHKPVYGIYGFVRFADEIVDSFEGYQQAKLLKEFRADTYKAIEEKISLNPILNSFQEAVHKYGIDHDSIETFLESMKMDLDQKEYSLEEYQTYILGSAEVVGLMCLRVFTQNDGALYDELRPYAQVLGSAFQKVNFLRDAQSDFEQLGRCYFPGVNLKEFSLVEKQQIEQEIEAEFLKAREGIKKLPPSSRKGVYLAYIYYYKLFTKIKKTPVERVMKERIRIPNGKKMELMLYSLVRNKFNMI